MNLAKSNIFTGGFPGDNVERNPSIETSVNSSLKYSKIKDSIEITCLEDSGKLEVE